MTFKKKILEVLIELLVFVEEDACVCVCVCVKLVCISLKLQIIPDLKLTLLELKCLFISRIIFFGKLLLF